MAFPDFDSKEDYLTAFRAELEIRGAEALSESAIRKALDDADEKFETLQGRGRTPTACANFLGRPSHGAEILIATRLLRLRPGSDTGPKLITYLRVFRALAIVSPVRLALATAPVLATIAGFAWLVAARDSAVFAVVAAIAMIALSRVISYFFWKWIRWNVKALAVEVL